MLFKYAKAPIRGHTDQKMLLKRAQAGKLASRLERIAMDPAANFYLDVWAVSAYEKFGLNENADGFEDEELTRSFPTFVGAWACLNHENDDEGLAVGRIVDAVYTPDKWVRIASAIERRKAEARYPGLETKIDNGQITDTSMGCLARESVCTLSKCANVATDESQYCDHVRLPQDGGFRGMTVCNAMTNWEPEVAGELNRGVIFFEDSIITDEEGADRNAKIIAKLASKRTGHRSIPADVLLGEIKKLGKTASPAERGMLATLLRNLEQLL